MLSLLKQKTGNLVANALKEIREGRPNAGHSKEARFRVAEFLLAEAGEYVDASFDLLSTGKARASLATSRWILEAALNLIWVTADPKRVDKGLKLLAAEALRLEAAKLEDLRELFPAQASQLTAQANAARLEHKALLTGQDQSRLDSLSTRLESIRDKLKASSMPNPYGLYRVCCAAGHPGVAFWRRFSQAPGGAMVTREPPDDTYDACFILGASITWLVSGAYCLTELGDAERLQIWWKNEIAPLVKPTRAERG